MSKMYEVVGDYSRIKNYQYDEYTEVITRLFADSYKEAREKADKMECVKKAKKSSNFEGMFIRPLSLFEVSYVLHDEELYEEPESYSKQVWALNEDDAEARVEEEYKDCYDFRGIMEIIPLKEA